jgi:hypothetical protein
LRDLIKRPFVGWESNDEATRLSLENTILPLWYDEVQETNRFTYRFNSRIKSWTAELSREQLFVLAEFVPDVADITKPFYISNVSSAGALTTGPRRKAGGSEDDLYSDIYRHAIRIQALGEEYKEAYSKIKNNIPNYNYISLADVESADSRTDIKAKVKALLLPGETLLGGELQCVTSLGRVIDIENASVLGGLERVVADQIRDKGYFTVPLLSESSTYKFVDINDEPIDLDVVPYIIGFSDSVGAYNPEYDIDQDGYISQVDMDFIRDSLGKSIDNTSEKDWSSLYFKLDKNQDGLISETDIAYAELSLHGVIEPCILIKNPFGGYCKLVYERFDQPYITYATPTNLVRGGTFEYKLPDAEIDQRISDGYIISTSGYVTGYNRSRGEIWTGRLVDNQYQLQKVSFNQQSKMTVIGMTSLDEVIFFLLESTVPGFLYAGSRYALLRVDVRKEKVEISNDLITFGIELLDSQKLTGIQSTNRKDIFRIFTDDLDIITIKLIRNSILVQQGSVFLSEGSEAILENLQDVIGYERIYNDIDSFGFNFGMDRLLFESNEDFIKRIERKVSNPPNTSINGMHFNYGLDLGLYRPTFGPYLYKDIYLGASNPIDVNKQISLSVLEVDINRYPIGNITLHIDNPVLKKRSINKQMFIDGAVKTVISDIHSEIYYELNSGDFVEGNYLVLKKDTIRRLAVAFLRGNVETLAITPDMDEELVIMPGIKIQIDYSTTDPDGVEHLAYDQFTIDIPSIDIIDTSEVRESGEICQISPNSKTAKYIPRTYTMTKGITKEYIGNLWDKRIDFLRKNDTSYWGKTIFDVTPFDDRFNSTYIVDKTYFNTGAFTQEQEEVIY